MTVGVMHRVELLADWQTAWQAVDGALAAVDAAGVIGNFEMMNRKLPELDQGMATLLQDLSDRGLLDSTIVWWSGEFGRSPRVQWEPPWNGGRNHYGKVFSALVAGGGFKGGHVVGSSDAKGEEVKDRPVYPCDLLGSIYQLSGIDATAKLPHPLGLEILNEALRLYPPAPIFSVYQSSPPVGGKNTAVSIK